MNKNFHSLLSIALLSGGILLSSCENRTEEDTVLMATPESLAFFSEGGEGSMMLTASGDWYAEIDQPWCTVEEASGAQVKDYALVVRCDRNESYDERSCKLTLTCGEKMVTVPILQRAAAGLVVPEGVRVSSNEQYLEVEIKSNVLFTVTSHENWVVVVDTKGLEEHRIVLLIGQNESYELRNARVTVAQTDGPLSADLIIWQEGENFIPVESVSLDSYSLQFSAIGAQELLHAIVLPADASDKTVTWSSSNTEVADVDQSGLVTAVGNGEAEITVRTNDGAKEAKCVVTVDTYGVESITLNKNTLTLNKGQSETLVATIIPSNAPYQTVTWSSTNEAIASVDQYGAVTAHSGGDATILAQIGTKSAACSVSVNVPVESIAIDPSSAAMVLGETLTLKATVYPSDATEKDVVWGSSDTAVLTVYDGLVTAQGLGTATIYASIGDFVATCPITVEDEDDAFFRAKLIKFYYDTGGPTTWGRRTNWCTYMPLDTWYGIVKTEQGGYIIDLLNNGLSGQGDLSGCKRLQSINCCGCPLFLSLDVSDCSNLTGLIIDEYILSVNASNCTSLKKFDASWYGHSIEEVNLSGCTALEEVDIVGNLQAIELMKCSSLRELKLHNRGGMDLDILDVSDCSSLEVMLVSNCNIKSVHVSGCSALRQLDCGGNQLLTLDITGCTSLEHLQCADNMLESLDVSSCPNLMDLNCLNNHITQMVTIEDRFDYFLHDILYYYNNYWQNGQWIINYTMNPYGWYYEGEPDKGYHGR